MIKVEVACLPIFLFVWGYFLLCATYLYFKVWIEGLIWKSILFEFEHKNNCLCGKRCGKADVPRGISEALLPGSGFRLLWMAKERQRENAVLLLSEKWAGTVGFAGLWDDWNKKNENIRSFTIITTAANDFMKPIHDRIPLILKPEFWRKWIAPDAGLSEIDKILEQPVGNDVLQNWEVGPYVNNAAHEGACCIARINSL